jgi:hypothetical protein
VLVGDSLIPAITEDLVGAGHIQTKQLVLGLQDKVLLVVLAVVT